MSGSDCANCFFWDKNTEAIVQWIAADENGVVNCLEPHPQFPMLATSGLDHDIKIWVPSHEKVRVFLFLSINQILKFTLFFVQAFNNGGS